MGLLDEESLTPPLVLTLKAKTFPFLKQYAVICWSCLSSSQNSFVPDIKF